jgi:hypothetical protein
MGHMAACRPLDEIQGPGFLKKLMGNFPAIAGILILEGKGFRLPLTKGEAELAERS